MSGTTLVRSLSKSASVLATVRPASLALGRTWPARRPIVHVPMLAGAGKLLATVGLKKLALNGVVKKLGPRRVLAELHEANSKLHAAQPELYSAQMFMSTHDALRTLERSLQGLQEQEQIARAWKWFEGLEKDNPSLAQVLLKVYVESHTPVKWASALLHKVPAPPAAESPATPAAADEALLQKLCAAHPELRNYHVVLVPKGKEEPRE